MMSENILSGLYHLEDAYSTEEQLNRLWIQTEEIKRGVGNGDTCDSLCLEKLFKTGPLIISVCAFLGLLWEQLVCIS